MKAALSVACLMALTTLAALAPPAAATHWTGVGSLTPLVAFSGETVEFAFTLNNQAAEPTSVFLVRMIACWHGAGAGSDFKVDDGTNITVAAASTHVFFANLSVPPLAPGLCHTTMVVRGQAGPESAGYGDYHFDVNYSTRVPFNLQTNVGPLDGDPGLNVSFAAAGTGGEAPYSFSWNFGDGTEAQGPFQNHTYDRVGRFNATLVAQDARGSRNSAVTRIWIHSGFAINAGAFKLSGDAPLTVNFSASAAGAFGAVAYNWSFGDGTNASTQHPNHTYDSPGTYVVLVNGTDGAGAEATVTLEVRALQPFFASIEVGTTTNTLQVGFTAHASGSTNVSYHWVFSDGAVAVGPRVHHTFPRDGTYSVQLHALDGEFGRFATANHTVHVWMPPPPHGDPAPTSPVLIGMLAASAGVALATVVILRARRRP